MGQIPQHKAIVNISFNISASELTDRLLITQAYRFLEENADVASKLKTLWRLLSSDLLKPRKAIRLMGVKSLY